MSEMNFKRSYWLGCLPGEAVAIRRKLLPDAQAAVLEWLAFTDYLGKMRVLSVGSPGEQYEYLAATGESGELEMQHATIPDRHQFMQVEVTSGISMDEVMARSFELAADTPE